MTIQALTSLGLKKMCFLGPALKYFFAAANELSGPKVVVAIDKEVIYNSNINLEYISNKNFDPQMILPKITNCKFFSS